MYAAFSGFSVKRKVERNPENRDWKQALFRNESKFMSRIDHAISEIENLDRMAEKDQWMNRIHPLVKLFLTLFYIVLVVSFPKYALLEVSGMAVYPIVIFITGELSFGAALYRLRVVLPLVCAVGLFNPFFDRGIVAYIGNTAVSGGVVSMLSLVVKGVLTVLAAYILTATTTIGKICYALRLLHIPRMVVTQLFLIYRYITVLLAEVRRTTQAYMLRAPGQKGIHFRVWGSLLGQMLLRSIDRAEQVYESMCLRGYHGEFGYCRKNGFSGKDAAFLGIFSLLFVVFRFFPVFQMAGRLFVP